jgi:hypothetical protein
MTDNNNSMTVYNNSSFSFNGVAYEFDSVEVASELPVSSTAIPTIQVSHGVSDMRFSDVKDSANKLIMSLPEKVGDTTNWINTVLGDSITVIPLGYRMYRTAKYPYIPNKPQETFCFSSNFVVPDAKYAGKQDNQNVSCLFKTFINENNKVELMFDENNKPVLNKNKKGSLVPVCPFAQWGKHKQIVNGREVIGKDGNPVWVNDPPSCNEYFSVWGLLRIVEGDNPPYLYGPVMVTFKGASTSDGKQLVSTIASKEKLGFYPYNLPFVLGVKKTGPQKDKSGFTVSLIRGDDQRNIINYSTEEQDTIADAMSRVAQAKEYYKNMAIAEEISNTLDANAVQAPSDDIPF